MSPNCRLFTLTLLVALVLAACGGSSAGPTPSPTARPAPTEHPTPSPTPMPEFNEFGVRYCAYVPGESEPALMPDEVIHPPSQTPFPVPTVPPAATVSVDTTQLQLAVFSGITDYVADTYVYPDYNGNDWSAITARYEALVNGGLTNEDFNGAMQSMINELGDHHSYFQSPAQVAEEEQQRAEGVNFVGIGVLANPIFGLPQTGAIIAVFSGSPAEDAGLRPHDLLLEVDGQPFRTEDGIARSLGPEGSSFELTYQRPAEPETTITISRRSVAGNIAVDYCIVPGTRIGYVLLPNFGDTSIDDQLRAALDNMTMDGPLDGLILDNRMNGGGSGEVAASALGFFTSGNQGGSVGRNDQRSLDVTAEDVSGSQTVPLVILAGPDTVSYGEIFSGVLQLSGRATVIGSSTAGDVETLLPAYFDDGSRLWLATQAFAPSASSPGPGKAQASFPTSPSPPAGTSSPKRPTLPSPPP